MDETNSLTLQRARAVLYKLAASQTVEELVRKVSKGTFTDTADLSQDIYVTLMEKSPDKIIELDDTNSLNYYIVGIIRNNLYSRSSPYYKRYGRWTISREPLASGDEYTGDEYLEFPVYD